MTQTIETQLAQLQSQVQQLVNAQREISESINELSPIMMAMVSAGTVRFQKLEDEGYFRFGKQAMRALDKIVQSYSEEDLDAFSDNVVAILDTVRNLTQPDVLDLANEATDAVHAAGDAKPVNGVWGMYKASKDDDVQRGMAVMFEVLRQVGKGAKKAKRGAPTVPRRRTLVGMLPDYTGVARAPRPERTPPPPVTAGDDRYDANGFLTDPALWTREIGLQVAAKMGIEMTDEHWAVVEWVRQDFTVHGASPNVRRIGTASGADMRSVYRLFPKAPGKTIAMIAGVPKPGGCI